MSILLHLSSILERVILDHDYLPAYSGYTVLEDKSGCILILDNSFEEDLDNGGDVADLDFIPLCCPVWRRSWSLACRRNWSPSCRL